MLKILPLLALLFLLPAAGASLAQSPAAVLGGAVKTSLQLDEKTLRALPATSLDITFRTEKGVETGHYTGALLWSLVQEAGLVPIAGKNAELRRTLLVTGRDGYAVALAMGELDPALAGKAVIVAYAAGNAQDASFAHLRLLVPGDLHGGRSVKDIASIEVK